MTRAVWPAAQAYGVELATEMCRKCLAAGAPGVHLYTLNQDAAAAAILKNLGVRGGEGTGRARLGFRS